jgi:hypothetical protein
VTLKSVSDAVVHGFMLSYLDSYMILLLLNWQQNGSTHPKQWQLQSTLFIMLQRKCDPNPIAILYTHGSLAWKWGWLVGTMVRKPRVGIQGWPAWGWGWGVCILVSRVCASDGLARGGVILYKIGKNNER